MLNQDCLMLRELSHGRRTRECRREIGLSTAMRELLEQQFLEWTVGDQAKDEYAGLSDETRERP